MKCGKYEGNIYNKNAMMDDHHKIKHGQELGNEDMTNYLCCSGSLQLCFNDDINTYWAIDIAVWITIHRQFQPTSLCELSCVYTQLKGDH